MHSIDRKQFKLGMIVLAFALALVVAGCGGGSSNSSGGFGGSDYGPSPTPPTSTESEPAPEPEGFELELYVQRENTMLGLSEECYSFYSDGTVELRHGSSNFNQVNDVGYVYGDENGGQIDWDSGRSSTYEWNGSEYRLDGALGSIINSCTA